MAAADGAGGGAAGPAVPSAAAPGAGPSASPGAASTKLTRWEWYRSIGSPQLITAPMVDGSELPFRLLCREFGAQLCYTPMLHSRMMTESASYMALNFSTCAEDRPLVAQLCGHDPETVLAAARMVEPFVDAIDLNLGCPQGIARRGHYGAYLLEEPETVFAVIRALAQGLTRVPVTAKIRILPTREATLAMARGLVDAGVSLIVVHGRTKENKKQSISAADWDIIRQVKEACPEVPVVANGSIACLEDVHACLRVAGVDGVMVSEALLENPGLLSRNVPTGGPLTAAAARLAAARGIPWPPVPAPASASADVSASPPGAPPIAASMLAIARRYIQLAAAHPPSFGILKAHAFKLLFGLWKVLPESRDRLAATHTPEAVAAALEHTEAAYWEQWAPRLTGSGSGAAAGGAGAGGGDSGGAGAGAAHSSPFPLDRELGLQAADYAPPIAARIAELRGTWATARAADPLLAWSTPEYLLDPAAAGSWYMRYRQPQHGAAVAAYGGLLPPCLPTEKDKKRAAKAAAAAAAASAAPVCAAGEGSTPAPDAGAAPAAPVPSAPLGTAAAGCGGGCGDTEEAEWRATAAEGAEGPAVGAGSGSSTGRKRRHSESVGVVAAAAGAAGAAATAAPSAAAAAGDSDSGSGSSRVAAGQSDAPSCPGGEGLPPAASRCRLEGAEGAEVGGGAAGGSVGEGRRESG